MESSNEFKRSARVSNSRPFCKVFVNFFFYYLKTVNDHTSCIVIYCFKIQGIIILWYAIVLVACVSSLVRAYL